jgi:CYTH domain-containing protein
MAASLTATEIKKRRYRLQPLQGVLMLVDEFQGDLDGLILAEAEFETPDLLGAFQAPGFAEHEVTDNPRYTGGQLATYGRPKGSYGSPEL